MKKRKNKGRLRLGTALFKGAYVHNTVLTCLTGLCPIAAVATNLKNAAWLCISFAPVIIVCEVAASLFLKKLPRWFRVCIYAVISCAVQLPLMTKLDANTASALGVYLPLLCVSGVTVLRCEKFAVRTTVYNSFIDSLAAVIGYCAVAMTVGAVRGFISGGTVFSLETHIPKNPAIAMPFGAFVILGFVAAVHKWSIMKYFPGEFIDTFDLETAFEKPVLKDPGIGAAKAHRKKRRLEEEMEEYDKIRPRYSIEDVKLDPPSEHEKEDDKP